MYQKVRHAATNALYIDLNVRSSCREIYKFAGLELLGVCVLVHGVRVLEFERVYIAYTTDIDAWHNANANSFIFY